jgi:type II secretory pathway component PulF
MRTTVTLDPDTEQILRRRMRERNISFKEALNEAIRDGVIEQEDRQAFTTETVSMGESRVNLDRALQVTGDLEDDELLRKMRSGS